MGLVHARVLAEHVVEPLLRLDPLALEAIAVAEEQVVAITFQQNVASWGLMKRLGMTRRPELDYDDVRFPDLNPTIVHAIRREEWRG